jgi:sigma-E factor negative regulatory protein RseA
LNPEEVESQLSAMFDGELPSAECELLSRRMDRDEALRARWSRYSMIGAVMRSEPVAPMGSDFAARVSAAVAKEQDMKPAARPRGALWRGALAASLVVAVAGLSLHLLRSSALPGGSAALVAQASATHSAGQATAAQQASAAQVAAAAKLASRPTAAGSGEPVSYVTPTASIGASLALQSQLANYIVAHSEYSRPLLRGNLLSALVGNEEAADNAPVGADTTDGVDGSSGGH